MFIEKEIPGFEIDIVDLLISIGTSESKSRSRQIIRQGAVSVDGEVITDVEDTMLLMESPKIVTVGKIKKFKVKIKRK